MGWASEEHISEMNHRYETDEEFRRDYDERERIDAALEAEYFEQERENEKQIDWFGDKLIDPRGESFELPRPAEAAVALIDDDLPF